LTLIRNDVDLKSKKARDPVAVQLLAEVSKMVRFAEVEAIFSKPKPSTDMFAGLVMFAGLPEEDARARALDTMAALREVMDDTQQHVVDALRTRAANRKGRFSSEVQQGAASLLKGAGYAV
jgi:pyridoxal/pyridoxine/pyridoxamine kinase